MSSVLVRGIAMPECCYDCPLIRASVAGDYYCVAGNGIEEDLNKLYEHRMSDCPLVEIPTQHGRLIDADEPMTKISTMMQEPDYQHDGENWMVGLIMARDAIDEAPTVIEGSEI